MHVLNFCLEVGPCTLRKGTQLRSPQKSRPSPYPKCKPAILQYYMLAAECCCLLFRGACCAEEIIQEVWHVWRDTVPTGTIGNQ